MTGFTAKWEPLALIEVMRQVIEATDPSAPASVSQRAYNEARCRIGFGHTPRAEKLPGRYGVEWATLIRLVSSEELPARAIARSSHSREREVLTMAEAVFAFQAVGRRLATDEVTPALYERERQVINAEVVRRYRHGGAATPLPSLDVVREKFDFAEVIAAAGLRCGERPAQRLMPRWRAVLLFVEHCGFQPTQAHLRDFARHHRVQLIDKEHERHARALVAARAESAQRGRWFRRVAHQHFPTGGRSRRRRTAPRSRRHGVSFRRHARPGTRRMRSETPSVAPSIFSDRGRRSRRSDTGCFRPPTASRARP